MRTYEAVFVLDERQYEDGGEAFSQELVKLIEELGGRVQERTSMGRKQFARPIRKQHAGIYWDFIFAMDPEKVIELKEKYRLNDSVFRSEVFLYEPAAAAK